MYTKILVAIENSAADRAVLAAHRGLARLTGAELLLVHVADGFAARHFNDLELRESEEIRDDRAYLERLCEDMTGRGMRCGARLAMGDPATELVQAWPPRSRSISSPCPRTAIAFFRICCAAAPPIASGTTCRSRC